MNHILSVFYIVLAISAGTSLAFAPASAVPKSTCKVHTQSRLFAAPVGPVARAKKMMDPKEYDRVVKERMKKSGLSRQEAEDDYNNFLENPPFYYALEKKEEYYKEMGYKDVFEGMIGEAEKEGKGDEMRERLAKFKLQSKIKATVVLIVAIIGLFWVQTIYNADPEHFLKGGLPDYSPR